MTASLISRNRLSILNRGSRVCLPAFLAINLLLAGCFGPVTVPATQANYLAAVQDTVVAAPDEIDYNLVAITPYDNRVIWEGTPGSSRVQMVAYTNFAGYDSQVGQTINLPGPSTSVRLWVTSVGEWKNFAPQILRSGEDEDTRIRQLLGLPPDNPPSKFVTFWINPTDLYRPSPDPEITDHEADLSWPISAVQAQPDLAYQTWFLNREATIYTGSYPYPWTRLGYTYDWGNPRSNFGPSEFVIQQGASVSVISSQTTADFIQQQAGL